METVVYLLGAGFSAPLGLPVVSNFFARSKDMVAKDVTKYSHFESVFQVVEALAVSSTYYKTNIRNIEDVLSILEMISYSKGEGFDDRFKQYIKEVVSYYTPEIPKALELADLAFVKWVQGDASIHTKGMGSPYLFGGAAEWVPFGFYVASVLQLGLTLATKVDPSGPTRVVPGRFPTSVRYGILTLNYDRVLETMYDRIASFMNPSHPETRADYGFVDNIPSWDEPWRRTPLAKLHGSVDGEIVPPTWSKGVVKSVGPAWKVGYNILSRATQLRIIGYSLPTTDAYIKYLLKSAATENRLNLKQIDVICLDDDGSVRHRYDEFITFDKYRFYNASTEEYLGCIQEMQPHGDGRHAQIRFDQLERAHERFVGKQRQKGPAK